MNLVFITIDSLRADFVGAYGNDWVQTPNLDQFAQQGTLFKKAYPESLPTIPARRALFTGRRCYPFRDWKYDPAWQVPGWVPLPDQHETLAETLGSHGYLSCMVTDVFHIYRPKMNYHRGFSEFHFIRGQECDRLHTGATHNDTSVDKYMTDRMDKNTRRPRELAMYLRNVSFRQSEEDYFPALVFRKASQWLEQNYKTENFFLYIDCFDPHEPWDPPQYYRDLYNPGYQGVEVIMPEYVEDYSDYLTDEELKHMRALYAAEVTMVDQWLGHFLNKLKIMGLEKNTLVVINSDHGHPLGENKITGKHEKAMLPSLLHIYQAVRHPKGSGNGRSVDSFVYNHDLYPTVFECLGLPVPDWAEGNSLVPLMDGSKDRLRDYVTTIFKNYAWANNGDYSLMARVNKSDFQLFDNNSDPGNHRNIAADNPQICEKLYALLEKDAKGPLPYFDVIPLDEKIHP